MTHAYDEDYLLHAQKNFGHMVDFAVNTCEYTISNFFDMFLASNVCKQFENGNPAYIAGKTGCELAREVILEIKGAEISEEDVMYLDKSPEYWTGYVLAFYAWFKNYKFRFILNAVSVEKIVFMYDTLHEADLSKFAEAMDKNISLFYVQTALARYREALGLSQAELADKSGIGIRIIQSYEQRNRDINKAKSETVVSLANALNCSPTDLLENY